MDVQHPDQSWLVRFFAYTLQSAFPDRSLYNVSPRTEGRQNLEARKRMRPREEQHSRPNSLDLEHLETRCLDPLRAKYESDLLEHRAKNSTVETNYAKMLVSQQEDQAEIARLKKMTRTLERERQIQALSIDTAVKERDDARKDASHHCLKNKEIQANLLHFENIVKDSLKESQATLLPLQNLLPNLRSLRGHSPNDADSP